MKKKLLCILLSLVMILGILPIAAFAGDTEPQVNDHAYLAKISFSNRANKNTSTYLYKMNTTFESATKEYVLDVPDTKGSVYAFATLSNSAPADSKITISYKSIIDGSNKTVLVTSGSSSSVTLADSISTYSSVGNKFTITVGTEDDYDTYVVDVKRSLSLSSLKLTGTDDKEVKLSPSFNSIKYSYEAVIPYDGFTVEAQANAENLSNAIRVNNDLVSTTGTKVTPNWVDGKSSFTVSVSAESNTTDYVINCTEKPMIEITTQPGKLSYNPGDSFDATGMVVTAHYHDGTSAVIPSSEYTIDKTSALKASDSEITVTYKTATVTQKINVVVPFSGKGTESEPYIISSVNDLNKLSEIVSKGESFSEMYFKMINDITLPEEWIPLGTSTKTPFSGVFDGDNHTIVVPNGGLPLVGTPYKATIKNLNVLGEKIASYGLVKTYTTGLTGNCITIDNVTLKKGSQTLYSGFIGGYASGSFSITIKNSTIEDGVVIGYDKQQSNIGSFAGELNGYIENCVSHADVYGVDFVGGICGNKGQTMGPYEIKNCNFDGTVNATGKYVGGISGAGYGGTSFGLASAGNTPMSTIQNCSVTGNVTGLNYVGGILGAEAGLVQCWVNGKGSISDNIFSGKISATADNATIGGIIGYMGSLNKFTEVSNNMFLKNSGAIKGIGEVEIVDTNSTTADKSVTDTYYFDSSDSESVSAFPAFIEMTDYIIKKGSWNGYSINGNHNRTDDPLGADADKLTKSFTLPEVIDINNSEGIIHIDAPIESFIDLVIDGKVVPKDCYIVENGSIIIKILPEYFATLSNGSHSVVVKTLYGNIDTALEVKPTSADNKLPENTTNNISNSDDSSEKIANTADTNNIVISVITTLGSAMCAAFVISTKKKHEN